MLFGGVRCGLTVNCLYFCPHFSHTSFWAKKALPFLGGSGDSWTRTNDPIDVNDVLYRLSHATRLISCPIYILAGEDGALVVAANIPVRPTN